MTLLGWIVLIVGAVIVGAVAQWAMKADVPNRWVVTAIGAFVGALVPSEWLFADSAPEAEGIALWPALIGGLVVGVVVDVIAQRYGKRELGGHGHGAPVG